MSRNFKLNIHKGKIKESDLKILANKLPKICDICGKNAINFVSDSLTTSTNRKITLGSKVSRGHRIKITHARIACLCLEQVKKFKMSRENHLRFCRRDIAKVSNVFET